MRNSHVEPTHMVNNWRPTAMIGVTAPGCSVQQAAKGRQNKKFKGIAPSTAPTVSILIT